MIKHLRKNKFTRKIIYKLGNARAKDIYSRIKNYFGDGKILELGAGTCNVLEVLHQNGLDAMGVDIKDLSFIDGEKAVIYDGKKLPFEDKSFEICAIITVLHHIPDPEKIILEAKRVAKYVLIYEDIYTNTFNKYSTFFLDSIINFEFFGHPHTNKSDLERQKTFENLGFEILDKKYHKWGILKNGIYFLKS